MIPGQHNVLRFTVDARRRVRRRVRGVLRPRSTRTWASSSWSRARATSPAGSPRNQQPPSEPASELASEGELAFNVVRVRGLPHDRGTHRAGHASARTSPTRDAAHASARGRSPTRRAQSQRWITDRRIDQAGRADAARRRSRTTSRGDRRLPREPEVDDDAARHRRGHLPRRGTSSTSSLGGRARHPGLLHHRRPQAHRHPLHRHRVRLLLRSPACSRSFMRVQLGDAERRRADRGDVQRALHDARHDDDLPVQHAGARRASATTSCRCRSAPRHGVPAAQRVQLLDLPVRRASSSTRASLVGHPPDGGWFAYVPLTDTAFSPGINIDFWGLGVVFVGISTTVGAVNFIVTIFKMRAPGMTLNRMPIFVWSMLVFSFMVIFAVPAVTIARRPARARPARSAPQFFEPAHGGSALLYQHLFWFWGHPEVYILFVPATGMVSMIIAGVLAPRARRLPVDRHVARRDRLHQLRRVGAPHVRDRAARRSRSSFFSAVSLAHRDPERRAVLRVDRDDVEGQGAASRRRCCSRSGSC